MNARQAELVLTILAEGSISGAAQKMFISQPALSQSLKTLEREINAPIFIRGTNPIQLTYAGEKLVETARQIVILEKNLAHEISDINEERSGYFRFGLNKRYSHDLLTSLVPLYIKEYPQVNLNITEMGSSSIEQALLEGSLDAGLMRTVPINNHLEYTLISEDTVVLLAPIDSDFAKAHPGDEPIPFTDLHNEVFVAKRKGNRSRFLLDQLSELYQIQPKISFEIDQYDTAVRIAQDCGCLMLSSLLVYQEEPLLKHTIKYYRFKNIDDSHNCYLCHHKKVHLTTYMKRWMDLTENFFQTRCISKLT